VAAYDKGRVCVGCGLFGGYGDVAVYVIEGLRIDKVYLNLCGLGMPFLFA
jgi:hypothetical protein